MFRSALPRGERLRPSERMDALVRFDPRSRAGSDLYEVGMTTLKYRFDPRSRAGSDLRSCPTLSQVCMFRSALPRGERLELAVLHVIFKCFDPRSRAGSDLALTDCGQSITTFRSALPRGERLKR